MCPGSRGYFEIVNNKKFAYSILLIARQVDREAIARHYAEHLVDRGPSDHNEVFEDIVVAAEAAAAESAAPGSSNGPNAVGDEETDEIVFVDSDEEAAQWEREQIAKEPQRWEALPLFNPVRAALNHDGANRMFLFLFQQFVMRCDIDLGCCCRSSDSGM